MDAHNRDTQQPESINEPITAVEDQPITAELDALQGDAKRIEMSYSPSEVITSSLLLFI